MHALVHSAAMAVMAFSTTGCKVSPAMRALAERLSLSERATDWPSAW